MPLTPDERTNEHLKLVANWFNTLATAIFSAGAILPAAQFIFGILPQTTDPGLVAGTAVVCVVLGFILHLVGHMFLGGLR